ncbi:S-layer homology domain-containing protein [Rossellomorea oryzaecorticis]|uniref:S-layer homology domain-containing protein n=1 Tax=Rossellomorea oryzaecorticis TaxID=1396505 RepID=A0ABW8VSA0_9BACI
MKKPFFYFLMVIMMVSIIQPAAPVKAASFTDVKGFKDEIGYLTDLGIIRGFPDGTFRPDNSITRLQAVLMLMREMKVEETDIPDPGFNDVKPGSAGYQEIAAASHLGIISGFSDGSFRPGGTLTRAQMAKILVNAYQLYGIYPYGFTDVSENYWGTEFISPLAANNITVGFDDGSFKPDLAITRAQFSAFMSRILEPEFRPYNPLVKDTILEMLFEMKLLDYDVHPTKPIIYFLDGVDNVVVAFNYETYEDHIVKLPLPAEKMDYANGKLYVTQLKRAHSSYWWEEEQEGAVAVVDAESMKYLHSINVATDPFDIAADDEGNVFLTSGSGQHVNIKSYNSTTGEMLSDVRGPYEKSYIEMHPSQDRVYLIDTTVSPRDLEVYPISDGKLSAGKDSPYHGDYPLTTDLTIPEDGGYIFNGSGNVFYSSMTPSADMTFAGKLDRGYTSIAFDVPNKEFYTSNKNTFVQAYNYDTFRPSYQLETYGNVQKLIYHHDALISLTEFKPKGTPKTLIGMETIYFK